MNVVLSTGLEVCAMETTSKALRNRSRVWKDIMFVLDRVSVEMCVCMYVCMCVSVSYTFYL